jgi:VWFA-related protein
LSGLLCAPTGAHAAKAQSVSKRKATARSVRRTSPKARPSVRRARQRAATPDTEAAAPDGASSARVDSDETAAVAAADAGGRDLDLPASGEVRIENRRGHVRVEVWDESHVSVRAQVEGAAPVKRSPIVIRQTNRLLDISVARASKTARGRVDLILRIPDSARALVVTTSGEAEVRGLPATLSVETASGDISVVLPAGVDADVTALTRTGSIDSTLPTFGPTGETERDFHATLGRGGDRSVQLRSRAGSITLSSGAGLTPETVVSAPQRRQIPETHAPREETRTEEAGRRPPTLDGVGGIGGGAGTPASPSTGPQEVDEGDVIRVDTELVTLNVSVVGRSNNRGLPDLKRDEFKLYEDGAEQEISHFDSSAAPFNLVLLIDLSSSTHEVINIIRDAALRFVAAARPADRIAVVTFANAPVIVSRLTDDRAALRRRLSSIEEPKGSTKVYDSIAFTMEEVLKDAGGSRRNAIVLMSDGLDSTLPNVTGDGSTLDYRELVGRVQEFDGVFYSLWLNTEYDALSELDVQPETVDLAHDRMKELAEAGGGMFYEVEKLEDLAGAYERVVADLGTVYSLGYRPTNKLRDGRWRAIRIAVARPNAVARGKRGYYAN